MIAVVADDFSGAAEVAGWAVVAGYTAELCRGFEATSRIASGAGDNGAGDVGISDVGVLGADVVVFDIDSRGVAVAEATARSRAVAAWLRARNVTRVFKKIDSVLRGHVAAECHALRIG